MKEGLAEKKSELTKLLSAEENRLNKIMEENKRKMEKLHDTIESSKKEVKSLELEKTKLEKEQ